MFLRWMLTNSRANLSCLINRGEPHHIRLLHKLVPRHTTEIPT